MSIDLVHVTNIQPLKCFHDFGLILDLPNSIEKLFERLAELSHTHTKLGIEQIIFFTNIHHLARSSTFKENYHIQFNHIETSRANEQSVFLRSLHMELDDIPKSRLVNK